MVVYNYCVKMVSYPSQNAGPNPPPEQNRKRKHESHQLPGNASNFVPAVFSPLFHLLRGSVPVPLHQEYGPLGIKQRRLNPGKWLHRINVSGFTEDDVKVSVEGDYVTVHAKQSGKNSCELKRKIFMPNFVDKGTVKNYIKANVLVLEADFKQCVRKSNATSGRTCENMRQATPCRSEEPLNLVRKPAAETPNFVHRTRCESADSVPRAEKETTNFAPRSENETTNIVYGTQGKSTNFAHRAQDETTNFVHRAQGVTTNFVHRPQGETTNFVHRDERERGYFVHPAEGKTPNFVHSAERETSNSVQRAERERVHFVHPAEGKTPNFVHSDEGKTSNFVHSDEGATANCVQRAKVESTNFVNRASVTAHRQTESDHEQETVPNSYITKDNDLNRIQHGTKNNKMIKIEDTKFDEMYNSKNDKNSYVIPRSINEIPRSINTFNNSNKETDIGPKHYTITMDISAFKGESIQIEYRNNALLVEAQKCYLHEGTTCSEVLYRHFDVPTNIDADRLVCNTDGKGMLTITAPFSNQIKQGTPKEKLFMIEC